MVVRERTRDRAPLPRGSIGSYSGSCLASPRYDDSAGACATTSGITVPSGNRTQHHVLLACGAIGPPLFIAVFLIEGGIPAIRPPGYNALRHPVSTFAIGDVRLATDRELPGHRVAVARIRDGSPASAATPPRRDLGTGADRPDRCRLDRCRRIHRRPAKWLPARNCRGARGRRPYRPRCTLHDAFSALFFLGLPAACCVVGYRFARAGHRRWARYSIGTAAVFVAGFILAAVGFAQNPAFVSIGGLLQRLTVIVGLTWMTALALHLIRADRQPPPGSDTPGSSTSVLPQHHTTP